MLNRKIQPKSEAIQFEWPTYELIKLDHQIPCYIVHGSEDPVLRIEFVFNAGEINAKNPLVAIATNRLLEEGTNSRTSKQIADELDFYGSYLHVGVDKESASVTLFCLSHHLENTLPIVLDILQNATFPEEELKLYLKNAKKKFIVNQEKVSVLSKRRFMQDLFGSQTSYGRVVEEGDYEQVDRMQVREFYRQYYHLSRAKLFLSGKVDAPVIAIIQGFIGGLAVDTAEVLSPPPFTDALKKQELKSWVSKKDAVQASIRVGCVSVNRTHPDYVKLQLLNTIFGGYFGSRLMANIREEKGYTYGIGSSLVSLKNSGFFIISTEVGSEYVKETLKEIEYELHRLCSEPIPADEIDKVRNYMLGELLRGFDGPFEISDRLKTCVHFGQDFSFYKNYMNALLTTSSEELQRLAKSYLQPNLMVEVVAGQK